MRRFLLLGIVFLALSLSLQLALMEVEKPLWAEVGRYAEYSFSAEGSWTDPMTGEEGWFSFKAVFRWEVINVSTSYASVRMSAVTTNVEGELPTWMKERYEAVQDWGFEEAHFTGVYLTPAEVERGKLDLVEVDTALGKVLCYRGSPPQGIGQICWDKKSLIMISLDQTTDDFTMRGRIVETNVPLELVTPALTPLTLPWGYVALALAAIAVAVAVVRLYKG